MYLINDPETILLIKKQGKLSNVYKLCNLA